MQERLQYDERKSWRIDGKKNILVLESGDRQVLPYQVNMIRYNNIEGLLSMQFYIEDTKYKYFYDVTSMETIASVMEYRKYDITQIKTILVSLYKTVTQMSNFLLDTDCLILVPEYIFSDNEMEHIAFCYYPDKTEPFQESLEELMEYFINHISYEDDAAVNTAYRIFQKIKKEKEPLREVLKEFCFLEDEVDQLEAVCPDGGREADENPSMEIPDEEIHVYDQEQYDHKLPLSVKIITLLIDFTGALGIAALLLHMIKAHASMTGIDFMIWTAAAVALLLGSSAVSCYISEHFKGASGKREYAEVKTCGDTIYSGQENTEDVVTEKCFDESGNDDQQSYFQKSDSQQSDRKQSHSQQSDRKQSYGQTMYKVSKKTILTEHVEEDEEAFEEMSFSTSEETADKETVTGDRDVVPATEKMNSRDRIPATVVMKNTQNDIPEGILCSLHEGKRPDIIIDEDRMLIGKIPGVVDICLDEACVSRIHAEIGQEDNRYYIMDEGSTNGSYVNGVRVRKHNRKYLKEGDIVKLADVEYQFTMKYPENDTQSVWIGV